MVTQNQNPIIETYDEKNKREQLEKESTPFWLSNLFVKRPCCCLIFVYIILIWLTTIAFDDDMYDLSKTDGRDFLVWTDPIVKNNDMRNLARTYILDQQDVELIDGEEIDKEVEVRSKYAFTWGMIYIWQNLQNKEYGLLLKDNLLKLEKVERLVNTSSEWKDFCIA